MREVEGLTEFVITHDGDRWQATCHHQLAGWSASADTLYTLRSMIAEAVVRYGIEDTPVYRYRPASDDAIDRLRAEIITGFEDSGQTVDEIVHTAEGWYVRLTPNAQDVTITINARRIPHEDRR